MDQIGKSPQCCKHCTNFTAEGFQQVADLSHLGVVVLNYVPTPTGESTCTSVGVDKLVKTLKGGANNIFVIINNNERLVTHDEILPEFDISKIPCPRCRFRVLKLRNLLKSDISQGGLARKALMGICDHCRCLIKQRQSCISCEETVQKLLSVIDKHKDRPSLIPREPVPKEKLRERFLAFKGKRTPEQRSPLELPTETPILAQLPKTVWTSKASILSDEEMQLKPIPQKPKAVVEFDSEESLITSFITTFASPTDETKKQKEFKYVFPSSKKRDAGTRKFIPKTSSELIYENQEKKRSKADEAQKLKYRQEYDEQEKPYKYYTDDDGTTQDHKPQYGVDEDRKPYTSDDEKDVNQIGRGEKGRGQIDPGEIGRSVIGRGKTGHGEIGRGEIDRDEIGRSEIGRGEIGRDEKGRGGTDRGEKSTSKSMQPKEKIDRPSEKNIPTNEDKSKRDIRKTSGISPSDKDKPFKQGLKQSFIQDGGIKRPGVAKTMAEMEKMGKETTEKSLEGKPPTRSDSKKGVDGVLARKEIGKKGTEEPKSAPEKEKGKKEMDKRGKEGFELSAEAKKEKHAREEVDVKKLPKEKPAPAKPPTEKGKKEIDKKEKEGPALPPEAKKSPKEVLSSTKPPPAKPPPTEKGKKEIDKKEKEGPALPPEAKKSAKQELSSTKPPPAKPPPTEKGKKEIDKKEKEGPALPSEAKKSPKEELSSTKPPPAKPPPTEKGKKEIDKKEKEGPALPSEAKKSPKEELSSTKPPPAKPPPTEKGKKEIDKKEKEGPALPSEAKKSPKEELSSTKPPPAKPPPTEKGKKEIDKKEKEGPALPSEAKKSPKEELSSTKPPPPKAPPSKTLPAKPKDGKEVDAQREKHEREPAKKDMDKKGKGKSEPEVKKEKRIQEEKNAKNAPKEEALPAMPTSPAKPRTDKTPPAFLEAHIKKLDKKEKEKLDKKGIEKLDKKGKEKLDKKGKKSSINAKDIESTKDDKEQEKEQKVPEKIKPEPPEIKEYDIMKCLPIDKTKEREFQDFINTQKALDSAVKDMIRVLTQKGEDNDFKTKEEIIRENARNAALAKTDALLDNAKLSSFDVATYGDWSVDALSFPSSSEARSIIIKKRKHIGELVKGKKIVKMVRKLRKKSPKDPQLLFTTAYDTGQSSDSYQLEELEESPMMNIYRVRPANPEMNWFEHNKKNGYLQYDTGEKLAEIDENGRDKWYYKNGQLALAYYDSKEPNNQQRVVVYSSGEQDECGKKLPVTLLAMFDHLGSGVVFDHSGKIRVKYNQSEGVVLDREVGPYTRWKWHSLNDPPVLQQVMIDTNLAHPDPRIISIGLDDDNMRTDDEDMLAIELDNYVKEKTKKLSQKFQTFPIRMKSLKLNDQFSLKIVDQSHVYLHFRSGMANMKLNLGMILDNQEIIDTQTADVAEVMSFEQYPVQTDSLQELQTGLTNIRRNERARTEYMERIHPTMPVSSADRLLQSASKPPRRPVLPRRSSSSYIASCTATCNLVKATTCMCGVLVNKIDNLGITYNYATQIKLLQYDVMSHSIN